MEGGLSDWKEYIKERVGASFQARWVQGMGGKSSLDVYRVNPVWGVGGELDGSWEATLLVRARLGRMGLRGEPQKGREVCLCGMELETVMHVLTECPLYGAERDWLVAKLYVGWEGDQWKDWKTRSACEATACVLGCGQVALSGKQAGYVKTFLGRVWNKRKHIREREH